MRMINEELAMQAVGLIGTSAATLMEDAHIQLLTLPRDITEARASAATLQQLGAHLTALGAAAALLVRQGK
jgi:hypothetical protein